MNWKLMSVLAAICIVLTGCQSVSNTTNMSQAANVQADERRLQAHLSFLADDLLEGRDTGSLGHEVASLYIATEFKKYGLTPAGDDGSYMQRVTFRRAYLDQSSPELILTSEGQSQTLAYPSDYVASPSTVYTDAFVKGELVFAGYGIVAPELQHDDYQNIDVNGKIVVVLAGKPTSFPSEEGAHFGSSMMKRQYAVNHGAIGFITITTPLNEQVRPYQNQLNYLHTPRVRWVNKQGEPAGVFPQLKNSAYLSLHAAEKLFAGSQVSLEEIYAQLERDEAPLGFPLNKTMSLGSRSEHKHVDSPNVAAVLPGADPKLAKEFVVYTAHSDHIGLAKTVKEDNINNGAMDNATGTAVLLETARMFSQAVYKPRRSILFLAVTGEEKGLLGSDYYAQNPTVPVDAMIANVNLDMPILTYEFADVIAFGANHSDMQASVEKAARNVGIKLSPDPWPQLALFTRSDHYSFVKQGVPAVFVVPGLTSAEKNEDASKKFNEFLATHYHKPTDDLSQPFNWRAATKFTEVNFQIGAFLAEQDNRPAWNDGDFFGETFGK